MNPIRDIIRRLQWRRKNRHNYTKMNNAFDPRYVSVGNYTYGLLTIQNHSKNEYYCEIGHFCSIADDVIFLVADDHEMNTISTYPFKVMIMQEDKEAKGKGNIIIEDDVWIGQGAIILSGVHVGQGAVIAAGAVVNKDVPPYAIVGGVPSRIIKYRFPQEIVKELLDIDYGKIDKSKLIEHIDCFYQKIETVQQAKELCNKLK